MMDLAGLLSSYLSKSKKRIKTFSWIYGNSEIKKAEPNGDKQGWVQEANIKTDENYKQDISLHTPYFPP